MTLNEQLIEALQWCSGSSDFQEGGKAREGWLKICVPLLNQPQSGKICPMPSQEGSVYNEPVQILSVDLTEKEADNKPAADEGELPSFDFWIDDNNPRILHYKGNGCHPASTCEIDMWDYIKKLSKHKVDA